MRLENWHTKDIFQGIIDRAEEGANAVMDEVVTASQRKLSGLVDSPPIVRAPGWSSADISFIPQSGDKKGKLVEFHTDKRWVGRRTPDNLHDSIRRTNKAGSGNVRVYAGNFKVYWARYIELGYTDLGGKHHAGYHYLRAPFHDIKRKTVKTIKDHIEGK
jgi:hypothetical protein